MKRFFRNFSCCLSCLILFACGGGSSGTGESSNSAGVLVDSNCQPICGVDLDDLGIMATESTSSCDGSFRPEPEADQTILVPIGESAVALDATDPVCIILSYQDRAVVSVLSYPLDFLSECSIEAVADAFPEDLEDICKR